MLLLYCNIKSQIASQIIQGIDKTAEFVMMIMEYAMQEVDFCLSLDQVHTVWM